MFSSLKLCKNKKKSQGVKGIGSEVRSPERIFCYKRKARAVTGKQNLSIEGSAKCHQGSLFPPFHKKKIFALEHINHLKKQVYNSLSLINLLFIYRLNEKEMLRCFIA